MFLSAYSFSVHGIILFFADVFERRFYIFIIIFPSGCEVSADDSFNTPSVYF